MELTQIGMAQINQTILNSKLQNAIMEFEEETGLIVESVDLNRIDLSAINETPTNLLITVKSKVVL